MSAISQTTYNLALTAQAASTMGVDAKWDAAVANYLRAYSLMQADDEYGAHNKAHNASLMHRFELEGQFGKGWRHHPGASEEVTRMDADLAVAREAHNQAYIAPYWKALRDLVATPSPSIVAATFKSLLITAEEIYNDSAMIADCMTIVAEDFARLAA